MKYFFIIKFILTNNKAKFRYSYIFPLFGTLVGSYIIFMIYSIMTSMEYQIEDRLNAFHYKYYLDSSISSYDTNLYDKGNSKIGYVKNISSHDLVNVYGLNNYKYYLNNKISKYLNISSDLIDYNDILIGDNLAYALNVEVGDSLILSYPGDININTNYIPSFIYRVGGIFDIDILNYDNRSVIMSYDNLHLKIHGSDYYYFDNIEENTKNNSIGYKKNHILSNLIIDALRFEKLIYYFFGILVISISCFMLFITIVESMKEKYNQILILRTLGLHNRRIQKILIFHNLSMVTVLSLIGIIMVNFTVYLHLKYGIFDFLYSSLPFNVDYVNLFNVETLLLLFIINILSLISTYIPLIIINKN